MPHIKVHSFMMKHQHYYGVSMSTRSFLKICSIALIAVLHVNVVKKTTQFFRQPYSLFICDLAQNQTKKILLTSQ